MDQKPKQLTLSFPIKSPTELEAEYRQWAKSLPPGVGGFSPLGSLMRVPVREAPPVQEEPRAIEDGPSHDSVTLHLDRPRPAQDDDPEARLMKWLEGNPPSEIRDAALEVLRDERCRAEIRQRRERKEAIGKPKDRDTRPLSSLSPAERAKYRAAHGSSDQEFKDWLESLPPGGTLHLVRRKPEPE